ncbi:MAG: hypothetical protein WGN25_08245 [Candidatus Electrothrix sp. GW3-4]|uniref:hypothetical protein n=1 Tax=Candidatus Electrothrix sp. GW3-4 TaxID=3126740 RepID=UPI0030CDE107
MIRYSPRIVGAGPRACPWLICRDGGQTGGHRTIRADTGVRPYGIGPALIDYRGGVRAGHNRHGAGGWNGWWVVPLGHGGPCPCT